MISNENAIKSRAHSPSYSSAVYLRRMEQLVQQIDAYRQEITAFEAASPESVEEFRIKWLGTKGW
jgi:hypothetical protein